MIKLSVSGFPVSYEKLAFPSGELQVRLNYRGPSSIIPPFDIEFEFENSLEVLELLLLADAIKRLHGKVRLLTIPYVPFGRQDRVAIEGECFSLAVFADLVNSIGAQKVIVTDPHSFVTAALIKNIYVIPQVAVFKKYFNNAFYNISDFYLISPDAGALKKVWELADQVHPIDVIESSKHRDVKTGKVTRTNVHAEDLQGKVCVIVDDIATGGITFVEIAKVLKEKNAGRIILMVTHGQFTKGLGVFDNLIDEIYTCKGRVK